MYKLILFVLVPVIVFSGTSYQDKSIFIDKYVYAGMHGHEMRKICNKYNLVYGYTKSICIKDPEFYNYKGNKYDNSRKRKSKNRGNL